ncbi:Threonine dehydratase biosynthetic [Abeliophyllum distichum]|uniref:Threonine dehydratase biosynthetic n=1 Tax=Abeliophyllum distichum TaxID=126358 RepID=A0ABD1NT18_9LAMI
MEALCFVPAQSPLLRSTFSTNATVKTPSTSVKSNRVKPFYRSYDIKTDGGYLTGRGQVSAGSTSRAAAVAASVPEFSAMRQRVYDVAYESPLQLAPKLSNRWGVNVWLKREDLQPVFSFKLRGAYNMMAKLPREQLERGVICSSAGNHAQGVALSAHRLGCNAVIAMPVTTPEIKWKSVKSLGATVVLVGDSYDEAQAYAKKRG